MSDIGINIISGFNVKSNTPVDSRMVANTIIKMNSIENVYDGLLVFCLEDDILYVYKNGQFDPYISGSSNSSFTYNFDFQLSSDEYNMEHYLIRT